MRTRFIGIALRSLVSMCTMKGLRAAAVLVCVTLVVLSPFARASVLSNGQTASPHVLTFGTLTLLASSTGVIAEPTFTVNFATSVFSDSSNTFCSGCLDFTYSFTNVSTSHESNERVSMSNFGVVKVDAGYITGAGVVPATVSRDVVGEVIAFNYTGSSHELDPGHDTVELVIETNAIKFEPGFVSAQDGTAGTGEAFQPEAVVPEPSSLILLGGGVLVLTQRLRRKLL